MTGVVLITLPFPLPFPPPPFFLAASSLTRLRPPSTRPPGALKARPSLPSSAPLAPTPLIPRAEEIPQELGIIIPGAKPCTTAPPARRRAADPFIVIAEASQQKENFVYENRQSHLDE
jgi:hypothetical protein